MPDIKRKHGTDTDILGTSGTPTTLSGTTESFSTEIDMAANGWEGTTVFVDVNFDATPTDDVKVKIYGSADGTNWDDEPMSQFVMDNGTDPQQVSFDLWGGSHYRIGIQQTGSTDSHDVHVHHHPWFWEST